ncbi:MAG: type II toxin-antitoxin system RelE/ParE family toxin [Clostridiales bacterium]|jgi:phage-related protein|nr:type II toxin-antitoxin system RelE/ParE family toxin [Clostridiales bacterium]
MYEIIFYKDKNGNEPIFDYIQLLNGRPDKDSRIKVNKIYEYLDVLAKHGKRAGEPYIKHLDGEIWELRPLRDRILFAAWDGKHFILLHQFMKDTQKAPPREIKQAKRNLADQRERGFDNE